MRKMMILLVGVMVLMMSMAGCGQEKQECFNCKEEKVCQSYTILGEEVQLCDDCKKDFNI
ncbi:MAG: hypothetical protein PUE18_03385 [Firmicutes bacterium]|nr:hypothetical protein [Bacillota bacterium]